MRVPGDRQCIKINKEMHLIKKNKKKNETQMHIRTVCGELAGLQLTSAAPDQVT